jgi:hypothetical protein
MKHSAWLQDRSSTRALDGKTPFEFEHGKKPHLAGIQEFGAAAYVKDISAGKLDARSQLGRFVGYDSESKGYRIYWQQKRSVTVERNVIFNEKDVLTPSEVVVIPGDVLAEGERDKVLQPPPNNNKTIDDKAEPDEAPDPDVEEPPNSIPFPSARIDEVEPEQASNKTESDLTSVTDRNIIQGKRARPNPGVYARLDKKGLSANVLEMDDDGEEEGGIEFVEGEDDLYGGLPHEFALAGAYGEEPKSLKEALETPNAKEWQAAHDYEIAQLEKLKTWRVVELPKGATAIPSSEVFHEKRGPSGDVETYRARIVAGGHKQVYNVNYTETFAAAAKMPSIRTILAYAAQEDWEIHQIDIKSAYLNAPLKEKVYMKAPPGVLTPEQVGLVLELLKAIYGLKQAGREWHELLSAVFRLLGFTRSSIDHSVFYKHKMEEHTIVAVATDDMTIASKRLCDIEKFKSDIMKHFDISDMGEIRWFLNFEIRRNRAERTISINQQAYIEAMAAKFGLTNAKRVSTPMDPGAQFSKDQCPSTPTQQMRMRGIPFAEAIGSVLWPTTVSRPDAAEPTNVLAQFVQNPGMVHWEGVKRVMSYLLSTKHYWLTFGGKRQLGLRGYCDSDWASQPHRHSISGYSFHIGKGAVTWSSKKQHIVALSSTEAEYVAQNHAAREALWLRNFINEVTNQATGPVTIFSDNQGAIALAKDNKFHARTKHIDIRYHFIREAVQDKKLCMQFIPGTENPADIFTKALPKAIFVKFVEKLGLGALEGEC